jgi:hypothetical protein
MVALQFLVLPVLVRIQVRQQKESADNLSGFFCCRLAAKRFEISKSFAIFAPSILQPSAKHGSITKPTNRHTEL